VKHKWVYLRPAANGIEQKRSLAEFFDWYNLRHRHQALGWRTPNEAYLGQSMAATPLAARRHAEPRYEFVDSRLRRSPPDRASAVPYGQAGENAMRFPSLPTGRRLPTSFTAPKQHRMILISGNDQTSSRLPTFSLSSPKAVQTTATIVVVLNVGTAAPQWVFTRD
jgi:Integrase core domain